MQETTISDMLKSTFEPKRGFRHLVTIKDNDGNLIIPAYVVRKINRPSMTPEFSSKFNKTVWVHSNLNIVCYDAVDPNTIKRINDAVLDDKTKWNINIKIFGSVAEIVEEWDITGNLMSVVPSELDWENPDSFATVELNVEIERAILK